MLQLDMRLSLRSVGLALGLGALAAACGCGGAAESTSLDGTPFVTLDECREIGGAPLFDPNDGRPIEQSCPEGLSFLGEFEEPFFGSEGGLCCGGLADT